MDLIYYNRVSVLEYIVAIRTAVRIETNCYTDFGPNRYILLWLFDMALKNLGF